MARDRRDRDDRRPRPAAPGGSAAVRVTLIGGVVALAVAVVGLGVGLALYVVIAPDLPARRGVPRLAGGPPRATAPEPIAAGGGAPRIPPPGAESVPAGEASRQLPALVPAPTGGPAVADRVQAIVAVLAFLQVVKDRRPDAAYLTTTPAYRQRVNAAAFAEFAAAAAIDLDNVHPVRAGPVEPEVGPEYHFKAWAGPRTLAVTMVKRGDRWLVDQFTTAPTRPNTP